MAKPKPENFLIGGLLYVLLFAGSGAEIIRERDKDNKCGGEERWKQKVLTDNNNSPGIIETARESTIQDLEKIDTKLPENKYAEGRPRMEIEKQVYIIRHCFITDIIRENDNDLHLVIEDGDKNTMIAEIPDPQCPEAANSQWAQSFADAKQTIESFSNNYRHFLFTVTGVLFVDKAHGQTGKAVNNVEIHPVLEIKKEKKINPIKQ
jgi:hypothetical protein